MGVLRSIMDGLGTLFRRQRFEQDLDDEVRHFVEMEAQERMRRGVPREEAMRQARAKVGGEQRVKDDARSGGWEFTVDGLMRDISYGARSLRRNPAFTIAAVLTLAIGIGGNTTVFSIVNAVLLRPPAHVRAPEELVSIYTSDYSGPAFSTSSFADLDDFRKEKTFFSGIAAFAPQPVGIGEGDNLQRDGMELVSVDYFSTLGVEPAAGRFFTPDEGRVGVPEAVAVIAYRVWQQRYAGRPDVVGQTIRLSGRQFTIIGVAPVGYTGAIRGLNIAAWVPATAGTLVGGGASDLTERGNRSYMAMARLATGVTVDGARVGMSTVARNMRAAWPQAWTDVSGAGRRISLLPERDSRVPPQVRGPVIGFVALLMGTVFLVLLVCCANVAGLMLARATRRSREMGVRLSLGASRGRVMRQLLTESTLVAGAGAIGGVSLALIATRAILRYEPPIPVRIGLDLGLDGRVLAFTLVAAVLTGLVFGVAPALRASRTPVTGMLKGDGASATVGGRRLPLQGILVSGQVAVSLLLLIGALLFLRSLRAASQIDPGFNTDGILILNASVRRDAEDRRYDLLLPERIREQVAAIPGVRNATWGSTAPLGLDASRRGIAVEGYQRAPGEDMEFHYNVVGPAWFETLGIPLKQGRGFTPADGPTGPGVIVINEAFAQRFWPGQSPLGRRISTSGPEGPWLEVIGVAQNARYVSLTEETRLFMYLPGLRERDGVNLHVRTTGDPLSVREAVVREIMAVAPGWEVNDVRTMAQQVGTSVAPQRIASAVLSVFGIVALVLVAVGLYGVVAYAVASRTREIGVRVALGARRQDVVMLMVRQGLRFALFGALIGIPAGLAATRLLSSFLIGEDSSNPLTHVGAAVLLGAIAFLAAWIPARRAATVHPMVALRDE